MILKYQRAFSFEKVSGVYFSSATIATVESCSGILKDAVEIDQIAQLSSITGYDDSIAKGLLQQITACAC